MKHCAMKMQNIRTIKTILVNLSTSHVLTIYTEDLFLIVQ